MKFLISFCDKFFSKFYSWPYCFTFGNIPPILILDKILTIFDGRVGSQIGDEELNAIKEEGEKRYKQSIHCFICEVFHFLLKLFISLNCFIYDLTTFSHILICQRYKQSIPPGFKDDKKKKNSEDANNAYGDLIIWKQIIKYQKQPIKISLFLQNIYTNSAIH